MKKYKKIIMVTICLLLVVVGVGVFSNYQVSKFNDQLLELVANNNLSNEKYNLLLNNVVNEEEKSILDTEFIGISSGYIYIDSNNDVSFNIFLNGYCHKKAANSENIITTLGSCSSMIYSYDYTGSDQVFVAPRSGYYNIELWGAGGGHHYVDNRNEEWQEYVYDLVSAGAYTKGEIYLEQGETLYVYVGGQGTDGELIDDINRLSHFGATSKAGIGGYNGGGDGMDDPDGQASGGGGGATDVRLISGESEDFDSLKSRIMVAAGGAGMGRIFHNYADVYYEAGIPGDGGTLEGIDAIKDGLNSEDYSRGATQTGGYKLGVGENGEFTMNIISGIGGGAGGYYGSKTGWINVSWYPSFSPGGGSSFVSGCEGCIAISEESTPNNIIHTKDNVHYSNYEFENIKMIAGNELMPNYLGNKKIEGNTEDGYARISYLGVR